MDYCHLLGVIKEGQNEKDAKTADENNPKLLIDKIENYLYNIFNNNEIILNKYKIICKCIYNINWRRNATVGI